MLPELSKHSEKLGYFYEVSNEGSLQATARKLNVAAASISHSIKILEAVVGAPLFLRSRSGVQLTKAGEVLFAFCRKYFRDLEDIQLRIKSSDLSTPRRVRIGTFPSIALYFGPPLIDSIKANTNILLSINTDRSSEIMKSLLQRNIDVAVTVENTNHERLIVHELFTDEYSFYAPKYWNLTELKRHELLALTLLYVPDARDENAKSLQQYIHSWDLRFRDEFELDSFEVVSKFTLEGYGIGILPNNVARSQGSQLVKINILDGIPAQFGLHHFNFSYRDDLDIPQSLISHLLENAKAAVQWMKGTRS